MSMINDIFAADVAAVHGASGEFAEAVTYTPSSPTGDNPTRTIYPIIQRDPPAPMNAAADYITPKMIFTIPNDQTTGISSATMDVGGDTITVAYRPGTTAEPWKIRLPSGPGSMDAAMLTFELR
jgi:hypothetical protein